MLSKEDKEKARESINKKIDKAKAYITELEDMTKPIAPENAIGRISRMDAINNKSLNEAVLRETRTKLIRLEHALNLIDKSGYGICIRCGSIIPFERMLIMPESTKCASCT
ncbi:MAG: TraR/DksA family transcriptional regulator [Bacteroidetes bacterium HGW-Bacteroidetes-9]|jgi:DnaK suppressor protein|nr:MAG: TraR/DksA family transcriptional regulator [Bacteroidetes bacterium HGW-Bacteroidetes-9]